jgi:pectate lyase
MATSARRPSGCTRPAFALPVVVLLAVLIVGGAGRAAAQAAIEGFGTGTTGGDLFPDEHVTHLGDSGPGSLRAALAAGNRRVVFDVGGTITLTSPLFVMGANVTIDGFTAPPPGITLAGNGLIIRGNVGINNLTPSHDVIVRGLRIRGVPIDGIQVAFGAYNVVISHVSVWGSGDGLIDITESSHDVTVAWSILAGAIKAMLVKYNAHRVTLHHNLWVGSRNRNPQVSVDDIGTPADDTTIDMRNNVVYDWSGGVGTTIHHGARANVVANFYSSPASLLLLDKKQALIVCQGSNCFDGNPANSGRAFAEGNVSGDFLAMDLDSAGTEGVPFDAAPVTTDDACTAATLVLEHAGVRPLDVVDQGTRQHLVNAAPTGTVLGESA